MHKSSRRQLDAPLFFQLRNTPFGNMQFKLSTLATVTLAVTLAALAAATPVQRAECTTGPVQCCNSVQSANDPAAAALLGLLGIVVQDVTVQVGLTCTPITVIGGADNSCSAQTVCCENNTYDGVVALGCTTSTINL
ncbi:unnamed protein product [Cyclocybe aegerita]|uniref:Hydrophobin n=1 Tax=Cyclocybe aegerita TaxID=1973307 RepID=A0A8S0WE74_CYCAE|nr:unnamed protein product [Cyclocybe aegerita]